MEESFLVVIEFATKVQVKSLTHMQGPVVGPYLHVVVVVTIYPLAHR